MFYESLGNRARGEIVAQLSKLGPMSTVQLEQHLGVTRGTVIEHLTKLEQVGLVLADTPREQRHGRAVTWSVNDQARDELLDQLSRYIRGESGS